MAFKDLLVHLDDTPACEHRIKAALALAKRQNASVTGVALILESTISRYIGMEFPTSLNDRQSELVAKAADEAVARFETAARAAGVPAKTHTVTCTATTAPGRLSYHARHADITFMG
ncbi:MAG: hypothetical protein JSS20_14390, partial [Proteobacteria bacterium]|nr:hypothetical protein [Pseudomonadota bacterium]